MISKEHKKHSELPRPAFGNFGRHEWAIVGTHCPVIKDLAASVIQAISARYQCAYLDASHVNEEDERILPGRLNAGAIIEYTNKEQFHEINLKNNLSTFQFRQMFSNMDLILVNGNHLQAASQIVVIDESKKNSLQKRLGELTNVKMILLTDPNIEPFDFVKRSVSNWKSLPVYSIHDKESIVNFFKEAMEQSVSSINGLVLAGGKSERMGLDKSRIVWHDKEQLYHIADLLKNFCADVFISCRENQGLEIDHHYQTIPDSFTGLGPYGAILSAFRQSPDNAWLVVASDLPMIDAFTIEDLIEHRNRSCMATTYESPYDGLPEPLITIWEPKSYPILLSFLSQGYSCPRKALRNNQVHIIKAENEIALTNVNTPEEADAARKLLQSNRTNHPSL